MKIGYYFHISNQYTLNQIRLYEFGFCEGESHFEELCREKFERYEKLNDSSLDDINLDLSERIGEILVAYKCDADFLFLYSEKSVLLNGGENS